MGYNKLLEIVEQTCNDPWQLFLDLQRYNPHTREMRARLEKSLRCGHDGHRRADRPTTLTAPAEPCARTAATWRLRLHAEKPESPMAEVRIKDIDEHEIDTILAEDIDFEGHLTFKKPLMIKGKFKGEIKSTSSLYIGEKAYVEAKTEAGSRFLQGQRTRATSSDTPAWSCSPRRRWTATSPRRISSWRAAASSTGTATWAAAAQKDAQPQAARPGARQQPGPGPAAGQQPAQPQAQQPAQPAAAPAAGPASAAAAGQPAEPSSIPPQQNQPQNQHQPSQNPQNPQRPGGPGQGQGGQQR